MLENFCQLTWILTCKNPSTVCVPFPLQPEESPPYWPGQGQRGRWGRGDLVLSRPGMPGSPTAMAGIRALPVCSYPRSGTQGSPGPARQGPAGKTYRETSNIRPNKSQNLNVSRLVFLFAQSLKTGVKSRMKMQLEQRRQAMLRLHLNNKKF